MVEGSTDFSRRQAVREEMGIPLHSTYLQYTCKSRKLQGLALKDSCWIDESNLKLSYEGDRRSDDERICMKCSCAAGDDQ
ncbi:hypothetical protein WN944_010393 [Citrus x changshan-huyou]|uniref:Uncharacterized protein n=1 Tax=Citrus x changshan-huyou TaxID=2935761 RepID=A0AAP0MXV2_9ROSI